MQSIEKYRAHYNFTSQDAENLRNIRPMMDRYSGRFSEEFFNYVNTFEDVQHFFKDKESIDRFKQKLRDWFLGLFSGDYNDKYLEEIEKIGSTAVKISLSAHYVNAAMHFVKQFCMKILQTNISDEKEHHYLYGSVEKLLDINLDAMTAAYIEAERRAYFISQHVESYLIDFAKRFSYGLNLFLVLGLVLMGFTVLGLFFYETLHLFRGNIETSLIGTLGSLLMLWVVIELVDTEVRHLKGGKFTLKIFIGVALVAVIRKLLVIMLQTEAVEAHLSIIAAIAILGGVYWLISKIE